MLKLLLAALLSACGSLRADERALLAADVPHIVSTTTLSTSAGRVAWSPIDAQLIAFDQMPPDRTAHCTDGVCFDLYLSHADGTGKHCLTCGHPALSDETRPIRGQPAFHPSGQWIVFQTGDGTVTSRPGRGVGNDLWLISVDGAHAYPLPYAGDSARRGVLHPHFTHDGRLLAWSEKYEKPGVFSRCGTLGCWRLRIADFSFDAQGTPRLTNVRAPYTGIGEGFYETGSFTVDDSELLYTGQGGEFILDSDIYALDLATNQSRRLTTVEYNEHPHASPDGAWITWMSTNEVIGRGAELWIMDPDGNHKTRLTSFNDNRPLDKGLTPADHEWSPDSRHIVQYVGNGGFGDSGLLLVFTLE